MDNKQAVKSGPSVEFIAAAAALLLVVGVVAVARFGSSTVTDADGFSYTPPTESGGWSGTVAVLLLVVLPIAALLAWLPGKIAADRGHHNAQAIAVCGWLGLLVFPAWIVALVWAYTAPRA